MYRNRIKCRTVNLIWGNHDDREIAPFFNETYDLIHLKVNKQYMMLCHLALATWYDSFAGHWSLYGHSHATAETWLEGVMPQRKAMDVGIDNAKKLLGEYRPFSFEEIKKRMDKRVGHNVYCKNLNNLAQGVSPHGVHPTSSYSPQGSL
jgi:calcineurin-like phosphoesterase family protein